MYFVIIIRFDYEILYRDKCYEKRNLYSINQFRHDLLEYFWKNIKSTRPKISFRVVYIVGNHRHKNWNGSFFNWTPGNISTSCLNWLKKKKKRFLLCTSTAGFMWFSLRHRVKNCWRSQSSHYCNDLFLCFRYLCQIRKVFLSFSVNLERTQFSSVSKFQQRHIW